MILVITVLYVACVMIAFKVIKIAVHPFTVAVAVVSGVVILGGVVTIWNLAAPMTGQMTLKRTVVRINPDVREFVSKVYVESNQLVKKGEVLFEISPERFEDAVKGASASLAASESTVLQLEAAVVAAEAMIRESVANEGIAKIVVDTATEIRRKSRNAVSTLKLEQAQSTYVGAQAGTQVARSSLKQAESSLAVANSSVDVARSGLNQAQFNLEASTYRSPVDGRMINFQIREGTPVARWQFVSTGTIMDLSDSVIIAVYPQNLLKYVNAGDEVEMAFMRKPGVIVTGKVDGVVQYTGEGQFVAGGVLPSVATVGSKGFLVVRIRLDDEELAKTLPLGAAGTTAIYSKFGKAFHVISKIALRIKGYTYYLPT
jgi:multidrug resistance efflux pump